MFRNLKKKESGMLTIEAVVALIGFTLAVAAVINFMNIFALHMKVQYALNQAAHEVAAMSYPYVLINGKAASRKLAKDGGKYAKPYKDGWNSLEDIMSIFSGKKPNDISGDFSNIGEMLKNPKNILKAMVLYGANAGLDYVKGQVGRLFANITVEKYLAEYDSSGKQTVSADDYLKKKGVVKGYDGMTFDGSEMFSGGTSYIVFKATYEVDMKLFMPLVKNPTLKVIQYGSAMGWLDGDGFYRSDFPRIDY